MAEKKFQGYAQGKLGYEAIITSYINALGYQILKLPNEIMQPNQNLANGCLYSDIVRSYINGVYHLEALLKPFMSEEQKKTINWKTADTTNESKSLHLAIDNFSCLVKICDELGLLTTMAVTADIDEIEEGVLDVA